MRNLQAFQKAPRKPAAAHLKVATACGHCGNSDVYLLQPGVCSFTTPPDGKLLREMAQLDGVRGESSALTEPTHTCITHRAFVNQMLFESHL